MVKERRGKKPWRSLLLVVLLAVVAFTARYIYTHLYYISSSSMEPTVQTGQRVWIGPEQAAYQRGDIIVFSSRLDFDQSGTTTAKEGNKVLQWLGFEGKDNQYLKRIVGVGGDKISCSAIGADMLLNGAKMDEPYILPEKQKCQSVFHAEVPPGHYWVEGDNRDHSADSRSHLGAAGGGYIDQDDIQGRAEKVIFPLNEQKPL